MREPLDNKQHILQRELGACWMGDRPGVNPLCACVTSGKFLNVSES